MNEHAVEQVASAEFPTRWGKFRIYGFRGHTEGRVDRRIEEAVALVMGDVKSAAPLVRVHSQCLTGDVFHSLRCDCRQQLELSLSMISEEGAGILIYEQQEGRGIGLMAKLQAYELQDAGLDTVEANERLGFKADQRDVRHSSRFIRRTRGLLQGAWSRVQMEFTIIRVRANSRKLQKRVQWSLFN